MPQNVLVLANNFAGLYIVRKEVIEAILSKGYKVYISAPSDGREADFRQMGCDTIPTEFKLRGTNPIADLGLLFRYCGLIKKVKPLAVLTYTIKPNVYGGMACRIMGEKQLANITGLGDAVENGGWLQKLTVLLYKLGIGRSYRVFFQNQGNFDFLAKNGIVGTSAALLPGPGVNLEVNAYQPYPADKDIVRFLFIGRMLKDKGVEEFFEMAMNIKSRYPNVEFQMLGNSGLYKSRIEELTKAGVISYKGTTFDVRPFIGAVECTVMPSYHEGMSNVNLESAANGRPVITTNVPGCRETVNDGQTGFLVVPKSTESLIDAVERFINLPYDQKVQMGLAGRKKVENEFNRQIVVDAYLKALSQCADGK